MVTVRRWMINNSWKCSMENSYGFTPEFSFGCREYLPNGFSFVWMLKCNENFKEYYQKVWDLSKKKTPKTEKLAKSGLQWSGKYPGEDWEIDFTHMPKANGYSCLQVWVDTFTGWIEAFPSSSEEAKEVIKILTHEITPRFGLPRRLQSDNGSAFKAAVTWGVSKALGIKYHLHCSWRPQSSGKVEKANDYQNTSTQINSRDVRQLKSYP